MARSIRRKVGGFTLVEMLVVLAIIGILAAILVPTIGIAVKTVRQGAIRTEMKQMETAIENYKSKFNSYPIDFQNTSLIYPHIKKISRRTTDNELVYAAWYTDDLPNPHYDASNPSTPPTRNPQTMLQHEAIVFLLYELSTNAEYPLGYRPGNGNDFDGDGTNNNFELVDHTWNGSQYALTGSKQTFFDFNAARLVDLDNDGWLEYMPSGGLDAPFVYFDARVYRDPTLGPITGLDFENSSLNVTGVIGAGYAVPYWSDPATGQPVNPDSYQLLCCGMDNTFGVTPVANPRGYPSGFNFTNEDRDNLANFAELRLDENLVE